MLLNLYKHNKKKLKKIEIGGKYLHNESESYTKCKTKYYRWNSQ